MRAPETRCISLFTQPARTEPHRENLKDDYDRIAQRALDIKNKVRWTNGFFQNQDTFLHDD